MVKRKTTYDSSHDEAPEAVSFGSSKKAVKGEQDAVQQFHIAQKLKRKEKNRTRDRAFKERAALSKGKATEKTGSVRGRNSLGDEDELSEESDAANVDDTGVAGRGRNDLEERMERAMREAEEESGSEDGASVFSGSSGGDAEVKEEVGEEEDEAFSQEGGSVEEEEEEECEEGVDENVDAEDEDKDEEMSSSSDSESENISETKAAKNYLPDHLFKSALSQANTKIIFDQEGSIPPKPMAPPRKRKRTNRPSKDIVLGSRTIRTLSRPTVARSGAAAKGMAAPRRAEKFMKLSLNLKGDTAKSKTKGWSRRPANLGVMKRSGPAANFVRDS